MKYIAKISWLIADGGGRKNGIPFNTDKYAPIIRTDNRTNTYATWSVVVNNYEMIDSTTTLAKVCYVFPNRAPNNLTPGLQFELYEGNKLVAYGEILEEFHE